MPVPCRNCETLLANQWKYCTHCGTPVLHALRVQAIPAVFRESVSGSDRVIDAPARRFDWQLALGLVLAIVGIIAIISLVSALIAAGG